MAIMIFVPVRDSVAPRRAGRLLQAVMLALCVAPALAAEPPSVQGEPGGSITVEIDSAKTIELPQPANSVFVANPEIADIQVPDHSKIVVLGKRPGSTVIYATINPQRVLRYSVFVTRQIAELEAAIAHEIPGSHVKVASAPNGVIVSGAVASPQDALRAKSIAAEYLGDKDRMLFDVDVTAAAQVNLRVRVAEVSRDINRSLGVNWNALFHSTTLAIGLLTGRAATAGFGNFIAAPVGSQNTPDTVGLAYQSPGGHVNVSAVIDALEAEGLVTILAEPNLTAVSGEAASFLAGGEFPVPVPQGGTGIGGSTFTIEWKRFGVAVDFTPTVLSANRISVRVRAEVSDLSATGAVTFNGQSVPGLAVRRADTTVELGSGQSFAIAGLFQNNVSSQVQSFPGLGDLPILGALFRSESFLRNESELVIIVTPYAVQPTEDSAALATPLDNVLFSNDLERLLYGRLQEGGQAPPASTHLRGPAGFMVE
jgi:pilus assembly protein CpaC